MLDSIIIDYEEIEILKLPKIEYAHIAHIINSKKMKRGKNIVYSSNIIYKIYWKKYDNWKIYDKINIEKESEKILYERNKI